MQKTLEHQHAIVTGGAKGIGFAIARELLMGGACVTVMGRNKSSLHDACQRLSQYGSAQYQVVDVTSPEQVQSGFETATSGRGAVDILVNNAGQAVSEPFERVDVALWQQMLNVNLSGTFFCMQAALPGMLQRGRGRVVNIASTAGLIGYSQVSAYCAAKHGVIGLTRAVALEVAKQGVTINAVCPGYTETDIVKSAIDGIKQKTGRSNDEARALLARRNPQGRLVQPDDVARAVVWLCQPGAASINGQAIPVDGGEVMVG